jgi:hypothetical protein
MGKSGTGVSKPGFADSFENKKWGKGKKRKRGWVEKSLTKPSSGSRLQPEKLYFQEKRSYLHSSNWVYVCIDVFQAHSLITGL